VDYIQDKVSELNVDVISVVEHWLTNSELSLLRIPGFYLAHCFCRPQKGQHGGSAIFVKEGIRCREFIDLSKVTMQKCFEASAIYLIDFEVLCISIYRSPENIKSSFDTFLMKLHELLNAIFTRNTNINIVLAADFNVDFLSNNPDVRDLTNLCTSFGLTRTVFSPTRPISGTCLDNVFTNIHCDNTTVEVIPTIFSDHDPILFVATITKLN
jgi:endonuclease/exonuclease/phosphatase (EEP) superfamily protein YafD